MGIQLADIAYGRVSAPDLDAAQGFLEDFGMRPVFRSSDALYLRGHGPAHHIHVVQKGAPGLVSLAFEAASAQELAKAALLPGAGPIESMREPGAGRRVLLRGPHGLSIEVVHGMEPVPPLPLETHAMNTALQPRRRPSGMTWMPPRPANVWRIGHGVVFSPDVAATAQWFMDSFGMLRSDVVQDGGSGDALGIFLRLDRGAELVDHHTVFIAHAPQPGLHHLSYEVADIDDLLRGKEHLARRGHRHLWGISRHVQGGQISDYWVDPAGVMMEHWTDSDRLDAAEPFRSLTREQSRSFWGPAATEAFRAHPLVPIAPWRAPEAR